MSQQVGLVLVFPENTLREPEAQQLCTPHATTVWLHSPVGFDVLKCRFNANALLGERADTTMAGIVATLWEGLDQLGATYGYFTVYADELDTQWIESNVLVSLLIDDWEHLHSLLLHLEVRPLPFDPKDGAVVRQSDRGYLVQRGPTMNPYAD